MFLSHKIRRTNSNLAIRSDVGAPEPMVLSLTAINYYRYNIIHILPPTIPPYFYYLWLIENLKH